MNNKFHSDQLPVGTLQNVTTTSNQNFQFQIQYLQAQQQKLNIQLNVANQTIEKLKIENEQQKQQINQFNESSQNQKQEILQLKKIIDEKNQEIEKQNMIKEKCISLQLANQESQMLVNQLKNNLEFIEITCKPNISQNISEEIVRLKFKQNFDDIQISYKRNEKNIAFEGFGQIKDKSFTFRCKCELSKIPKQDKNPQIIQTDREIYLKFQI